MLRSFAISFIVILTSIFLIRYFVYSNRSQTANVQQVWWQVQSIDTMKYSRDLSRQMLNDPAFDTTIDMQVGNIAKTGATHVAIATPYDEEFIPILSRWVAASRRYNLHVWFRGNFSGWEQWFGYPKISGDEHVQKTDDFIRNHPDLFVDGDIFTPCPECENGGPGDPRQTGDVAGFRRFLIHEHQVAANDFVSIHKNVSTSYNSMNYDIATLVMDPATTRAVGGVVAIDHYVETPIDLVTNIQALATRSNGKIFLGEFGVPIPDINGTMNDDQQATWIDDALNKLSLMPIVIGVNYWVNVGGSTQMWSDNGTAKPAVGVITQYYTPKILHGSVYDQYNSPIANVEVSTSYKTAKTDACGQFILPILPSDKTVFVHTSKYDDTETQISSDDTNIHIIITKIPKSFFDAILGYINGFLH